MAYGPAKPPMFANEFISAIPPAAAAVKNFDGSGHKGPCTLRSPPAANDRNSTTKTGDFTRTHLKNPMAAFVRLSLGVSRRWKRSAAYPGSAKRRTASLAQ